MAERAVERSERGGTVAPAARCAGGEPGPAWRVATSSPALGALGLAAVVVVWWWGGRSGWGSGMVVTPRAAVRPLTGSSADVYRRATRATVWEAARGLAIGATLAFAAAIVAATVPAVRRSITRLAAIANAAPWVAVAPCLLVVLGRERGPVAVAAIAVFFFVFVSTSVGLAAAPRDAGDVLSALGAPRWRQVRALQLPAALPSVVDGLKLAAPAALAGAVFGEWYGADRGLGVLLVTAMQSARAERLWAASLVTAACGLLMFAVLALAQRLLAARYGRAIAAAPERRRHRGARILLVEGAGVVALAAALVGAYWAWIHFGDVSPLVAPAPSAVGRDLLDAPGVYASAAWASLQTAAIALVVGGGVAVVLAVAAWRSRVLSGVVVPPTLVLAATPLVALFPLVARMLGYGPPTVRALAALMVFFPVFVYARSGLAAASPASHDVLRALGAPPRRTFVSLVLPAAVPHLASGLRIAAGSSVIAAVVGESLIGRRGLGVEFSYAYRLLDLPRAFGAALVIVVVSVVVFAVSGWLERVVHTRWS